MADLNLELTPSALLSHINSCLFKQPNLQPQSHKLHVDRPIRVLVAYSGGLDSHVLLHLLSRISSSDVDVRAIYINHGLQEQAVDWGLHCNKICEEMNIPFECISVNLKTNTGESIEELARKARYHALFDSLKENEILVTAHHQNDQAETLLLQLFRGAGVQGLAAMPHKGEIKFGGEEYIHLRPLLNQSRESLEKYAKKHNLKHIEDPSNNDTSFDRNFLRQEIMPVLRQRWLGIDKAISRTASIQAETSDLLDEIAEEQLTTILSSEPNHLVSFICNDENQSLILPPIDITKLSKLSKAKQRLLLRYWISKQGFTTPSTKKLEHVFSDVIESSADKQPLVKWQETELRRNQQLLYIMSPLSSHDVTQEIPWQNDGPLYIQSLNLTLDEGLKDSDCSDVTIRFRQGGEAIEISKRGNISLKNLFQESQIPTWLRSRLPLVYNGEKLVKIVGLNEFKGHLPPF